WTSHLPQVAATALALTLQSAGLPRRELGPGGQDTTRLAASSPQMWSAICVDNAAPLEAVLASFAAEVRRLQDAVGARDVDALRTLFAIAREWAEQEHLPR